MERKNCSVDVKYQEKVCVVVRCPIILLAMKDRIMTPNSDSQRSCFNTLTVQSHPLLQNTCNAFLFSCNFYWWHRQHSQRHPSRLHLFTIVAVSSTRCLCIPAFIATYPPITVSSISSAHAQTSYVETLLSGLGYQYMPLDKQYIISRKLEIQLGS